MRDLYLHIGLPKTGTTYLQKVLWENRALLAAEGLGFGPYLDPETGSHYPRFGEALASEGPDRVFAATAACPGEKILVSAEDLVHYIRDTEDGRPFGYAIRDAARRHFRVKVILFVRRQDYMAESRFYQWVRVHYAGDIRQLDQPHFEDNHDRRVRQLEEIFGTENIAIGLYRDGEANDVVGTLLGMIGIDAGDRLVRDIGRQNVSPHRRKIFFLSQIPKDARRAAGFLGRVVVASDAIAADGGRFLLSPQERRDLVARYQASNRALVARYRLADPGMFVELPDAGEAWSAPAPITRGEIAAVFREAIPAAWRDRRPAAALVMTARLVRLFAVMMAGHRRNGGMSPAPLPDRGPSYAGDQA